jgi:hypothetical protein
VVTKSGSKFASSAGDWKLLHKECGDALRTLHAAGYRIVVFRRVLRRETGGVGRSRAALRLGAARGRSRPDALRSAVWRSNQGGIKTAVDKTRAGYVKGYFDSAFDEVRPAMARALRRSGAASGGPLTPRHAPLASRNRLACP